MSVSIDPLKLVGCIAMIVFGLYCLIYIRGKQFYHSNLLSRKPNERLHPWFARPMFFFVMGIFWIYAAVVYFRQELWPPR
jgi:hypothetical protein